MEQTTVQSNTISKPFLSRLPNKRTLLLIVVLFLSLILYITLKFTLNVPKQLSKPTIPIEQAKLPQIPNGKLAETFYPNSKRLMTIPDNCDSTAHRYFTSFSANGKYVGFVCAANNKYSGDFIPTQIILNGIRQKEFNETSTVAFDDTYDEFAYTTKSYGSNGGDGVVFNGINLGNYYSESLNNLTLDSGHLAYVSRHVTGTEFYYDGKVVAKTGDTYSFIYTPKVSADGNHYFFSARKGTGKETYLIRDGVEIAKVNGFIRDIVVNNDGSKSAYIVETQDNAQVFFDKIPNKIYKKVINLTMSNDGNHVAFVVQDDKSLFWVVDGVEYTQYKEFGELFLFSSDGNHFAFRIVDPLNSKYQAIVEDGKVTSHFTSISDLVFSNDSSKLAFFAIQNNISYVVVGNSKYPIITTYPEQIASNLTFAPDNKKVLYRVADYSLHENIVIDGKISETYDVVPSGFYFSKEGNLLGFGVQKGMELWWVTMDFTKQIIPDKLPVTVTPTPTPLPTVLPSDEKPSFISYETYISNELGVSFNYQSPTGQPFYTKKINNSVYLYSPFGKQKEFIGTSEEFLKKYSNNYHIEVFQKNKSDTLEQAIINKFFNGKEDPDCDIKKISSIYPSMYPTYQEVQITIPDTNIPLDMHSRSQAQARCPGHYSVTWGLNYFLYNPAVSDKFVFVQVGQDNIRGKDEYTWDRTIKIF